MSILAANFKHLYQKRSFCVVGLVFGVFAFIAIMVITRGGFTAPIAWMFFISTLIASLPIDILTKPFSFCLPGHNAIPRKFLFSVGLVLSFLWSLSFLFYPDLNIAKTILACLSAFSIFTIFYWLGVWVVSKFRNWTVVFAVYPLIMLGNELFNLSSIVEDAIVKSPLPMILLGGIVNFLAWNYWGRPNLARRYCGVLWMGALDGLNMEKITKFKSAKLAETEKKKPSSIRISSGVESFFVSRISRAGIGSLPQYIWGALYKTFGIMGSQYRQDWMRFFMLMLPILCFLCYMPGGGRNIIFFMPGLMVVHVSLWVYSSLSVCGGRRQRFWSALTLAITTGILVTVAVAVLTMTTHLLARIMPELTIKGHEFAFNALNMNLSLVPFLMISVTFTIGLIFHKKPMLTMLFAVLLFQIPFAISIISELTIMNWTVRIEPLHIIIMLLCGWAVFVAVLRYVCLRRCLVGQGK